MKLFYSPASPFARKVHITLIELGMADSVELRLTPVLPGKPIDEYVKTQNPLGKIPALQIDTGETLFDSTIICEYLDSLSSSKKLLPAGGIERYQTLTQQTLAQGICESTVSIRYETFLRPEDKQWDVWIEDQWNKVDRALNWFNSHPENWQGDIDLAQISLGCALGYLDFRAPDHDWRRDNSVLEQWFETFAQGTSFQATLPHA